MGRGVKANPKNMLRFLFILTEIFRYDVHIYVSKLYINTGPYVRYVTQSDMKESESNDVMKLNLLKFEDTPQEYHRFRHNWTNFESILQNKYPQQPHIIDRVRKFGKDNESKFSEFDKDLIKQIIVQECVHEDPSGKLKDYAVVSTQRLRKTLGTGDKICQKCSKREECSKLSIQGMDYNNMQAILQIIYQIRNNINHHGKPDLTTRNISLVKFADQIISKIIEDYMR